MNTLNSVLVFSTWGSGGDGNVDVNCAESNSCASQQYEKKNQKPLEFRHAKVHIWIRKMEVRYFRFFLENSVWFPFSIELL